MTSNAKARPARRARFSDRNVNRSAAAVLALTAVASLVLLMREMSVNDMQRQAIRFVAPEIPLAPDMAEPGGPVRARVAGALLLARHAAATPHAGERRAELAHADAALADAIPVRTHWGEAQVVAAFVSSLRDGDASRTTLRSFAASYVDSPFLRHAAAWRVQYGFNHWAMLTSSTQASVAEEAAWLAMLDAEARPGVFDLARDTPAYRTFMLHWLRARTAG